MINNLYIFTAFTDVKVKKECYDDELFEKRALSGKQKSRKDFKAKKCGFSRSTRQIMHTQFGTHQPIVTDAAYFTVEYVEIVDQDGFIDNPTSIKLQISLGPWQHTSRAGDFALKEGKLISSMECGTRLSSKDLTDHTVAVKVGK